MKIQISEEYLARESINPERSIDWISSKGESVKQWVINYCKRNKIQLRVFPVASGKWYGETSNQVELWFKSEHQANCFVRQGNRVFPYFEFI